MPSVNLIDGAAKQFDDGLYAAIDLASFKDGIGDRPAALALIESIFGKLPQESQARPTLAAALKLGGKEVELTAAEETTRDLLIEEFDLNRAKSKPISF